MSVHALSRSAAETALGEQFLTTKRFGQSRRRAAAFERFSAYGLPTRRVESWHYTDLRTAMAGAAPPASLPDRAALEAARTMIAKREGVAGAVQDRHGGWGVCAGTQRPDAGGRDPFRREEPSLDVEDAMASLVAAMAPERSDGRGRVRRATGRACRNPSGRDGPRRPFALFLDRDRDRKGGGRDNRRDVPWRASPLYSDMRRRSW